MIREPKVTSFCGCLSLEAGCRVIAWIKIIGNFILFVLILALLIIVAIYYNEVRQSVDISSISIAAFVVFNVIWSLMLIYIVIEFVIAIIFLRAIRKRETAGMIPFMIILGVGLILAFIQLINTGIIGLFPAIFSAAWNVYVIVVIYSLYITFKNEKEFRENPTLHYQTSVLTSVYPTTSNYAPNYQTNEKF